MDSLPYSLGSKNDINVRVADMRMAAKPSVTCNIPDYAFNAV